MPKKFNYLINEKINVNGRQIYCKVTGDPGTAADGEPYVIAITGGPGFDHEMTELYIRRLIDIANKQNLPLPHFIFYDHLGCGQSDKAIDPNEEYTVDHFTDLAADLVKLVKNKLNLPHMNLYVEGGSFGSLVAMNFPARKPEWLDPNSDIHLKQVTSKVAPNGAGMWEYTSKFLEDNYRQHPNYENIVKAQKKLFSGDLQNKSDYIINFVLHMASLYAKDIEKSFFNKMIQRMVVRYPQAVIKGLDVSNRLFKNLGIELEGLNFADITLGKCSLDVLNHFFKMDFNGFNLIETVRKNKHLYQQIPICLISASKDHIVDYRIAQAIHQELPDSSATIIFDEPHMLSKGPNRGIYDRLNYDLLVSGHIPPEDVNHPVISIQTVDEKFNKRLAAAHSTNEPRSAKPHLSTAILLTNMPKQASTSSILPENNSIADISKQEDIRHETPEPSSAPEYIANPSSLRPNFT